MSYAEQMISAAELKKRIAKVKKCFRSESHDYMTGYISALSFVEGLVAILQDNAESGGSGGGNFTDDKSESGLLED